jgi:hypothetical protein
MHDQKKRERKENRKGGERQADDVTLMISPLSTMMMLMKKE